MSWNGEFAGKKVVLTGACGVIGRWIAASFAREGARLCLSDMRADLLDTMARELELSAAGGLTHATRLADAASVDDLVAAASKRDIEAGLADYGKIGAFLDGGLGQQVEFDVDSFERATGRKLSVAERRQMIETQRQAMRWTFLGSGMTHPRFLEALERIDPAARRQVEGMAPTFS